MRQLVSDLWRVERDGKYLGMVCERDGGFRAVHGGRLLGIRKSLQSALALFDTLEVPRG